MNIAERIERLEKSFDYELIKPYYASLAQIKASRNGDPLLGLVMIGKELNTILNKSATIHC